ncbi:kynurenine aminotransferase-like [Onthophagus taurus]|uniref:kynurenine aminotransferase-like n=1 Tax=Onthophagus taurus TaxID=166361 RepID=UPI0039BE921A
MDKFALPHRFCGFGKSVWDEYNRLAIDYKPLNLGMGFPNFHPPEEITKALFEVANSPNTNLHQYTRGYGHPRLISILTKLYSKLLQRNLNGQTEFLVTNGAQQALYSAITGHIDEGDEAIIIEPYFDLYGPMIKIAGGVAKFIPLRLKNQKNKNLITSNDWVLDPDELEKLFNKKTKLIILNTPHNPLGKVFTLSELEMIANLCIKYNVLCISDEVYEFLVYEPSKHVRISTLPGMFERTLTIGSAGKTFSVTGWRVGWIYGGQKVLRNAQVVHQNCVYTCTTPIQEAIAIVLEKEFEKLNSNESYFAKMSNELKKKRDFMVDIFQKIGMVPSIPDGGYFILADWSNLAGKINLDQEEDEFKDYKFTKWLCKNVGILGIPPSAFYSDLNKNIGENFVRLCFIKSEEDLMKTKEILEKLK